MKILNVITSLLVGGAEMLVVEMTTRLRQRGHQVDVCVFKGVETPLMDKLVRENPGVKLYKLGTSFYNPLYIYKLRKIIRRYDIIHTHNSSPQLFVALSGIGQSVALCSTEHNTFNRKRDWKWYSPIESWMYGRYDHVVCISKIAEQKLRDYLGSDWSLPNSAKYRRIETINNGVDIDRIYSATPVPELLEQKDNRTAILMVAGFRPQKDQDTLIRALSHLDREAYEVWLAGVGECQAEVEALVESLHLTDRVRFLGLRTDIPNVLKAADIICMSSHWEGLSLSNVEGMSAGKPFIASDVNGLREVTKGYGLLFPHEDDKALAETIERLQQDADYYKSITERCLLRARQFDIGKMVAGYEAVYHKILSNK